VKNRAPSVSPDGESIAPAFRKPPLGEVWRGPLPLFFGEVWRGPRSLFFGEVRRGSRSVDYGVERTIIRKKV